jgi:hypothetical protein
MTYLNTAELPEEARVYECFQRMTALVMRTGHVYQALKFKFKFSITDN